MRDEGIDAFGPLPADTVFHDDARSRYDGHLQYHDQALIPAKALGFDDSVNVTLGLPFIRTSPDHGTSLRLAGSGFAKETSLVAALQMADRMTPRRNGSLMAALDGLPPLRDVIARHGLDAKKALAELPPRSEPHPEGGADCGSLEGVTVIEVGPGPGGLTRAILAPRRQER